VAERSNHAPHRLVRLAQLGHLKSAVQTESIWHCVSCLTCTLRCPKQVDCAGVMDALRQLAIAGDEPGPGHHRVAIFYKAFLDNLRRNGRLHELELVGQFKASVVRREMNVPFLFKDALLAPRMMQRGKLHFAPGKVRDRGVVARIFKRCLDEPRLPAEAKREAAHT
jgi:heterodisulfide reductase subunit C